MMTKMAFSEWKALISLTAALFFACSLTVHAEEPAGSGKPGEPGQAAASSREKPDEAVNKARAVPGETTDKVDEATDEIADGDLDKADTAADGGDAAKDEKADDVADTDNAAKDEKADDVADTDAADKDKTSGNVANTKKDLKADKTPDTADAAKDEKAGDIADKSDPEDDDKADNAADGADAAKDENADGATSVSDAALATADPIVVRIREKISGLGRRAREEEITALLDYYGDPGSSAIWVAASGLTDKGKAASKEIRKADEWGLRASDFQLPLVSSGNLSPDAVADAEVKLALAVLKYARHARGGRVHPRSISKIMDYAPPLLAPSVVLTEVAATDVVDDYLRSLHPKHEQFHKLRAVLLKLQGGQEIEPRPKVDPALNVVIPPGRLLRIGVEDPQVALLRKRLKVPAEDPSQANVFDEEVREAVLAFQRSKRLRPDGLVGNGTRARLNGRQAPIVDRSPGKQVQRILINMERWRWMPEDLGEFYVWDNVPEFLTRVVKNGKIIHTDKIVVGQPSWPTPSFSADMKTIVFHPSWGVPAGIKRKELLPLLRKSSGGGFFLFGGGYTSQAVLDAHDLRVTYNGRPINPNSVDWNSVNINAFSFTQPPGPKNVLGTIKFMFPNKHSVYMHDTPEKELFARSFRGESHGCMRVAQPRRLAEILLAHDKGWSAARVRSMFSGYTRNVSLDAHIPVHITYLTARVDENGRLRTYGDLYGLDSRVGSALFGRSVRFGTPRYEDAPSAGYNGQPVRPRVRKKKQAPSTLADAIQGLFSP
jgi:murein L,D-transpeptidase YcbB/YkuD